MGRNTPEASGICNESGSRRTTFCLFQPMMMIFIAKLGVNFLLLLCYPSGSPTTTIIAKRFGNYVLKVCRKFQKCSFKEKKLEFCFSKCMSNKQIDSKILKI